MTEITRSQIRGADALVAVTNNDSGMVALPSAETSPGANTENSEEPLSHNLSKISQCTWSHSATLLSVVFKYKNASPGYGAPNSQCIQDTQALKKSFHLSKEATMSELRQVLDKSVWVSKKQLKAVIRSSMFLKEKHNARGIFTKR
jgi:hypothetical protein